MITLSSGSSLQHTKQTIDLKICYGFQHPRRSLSTWLYFSQGKIPLLCIPFHGQAGVMRGLVRLCRWLWSSCIFYFRLDNLSQAIDGWGTPEYFSVMNLFSALLNEEDTDQKEKQHPSEFWNKGFSIDLMAVFLAKHHLLPSSSPYYSLKKTHVPPSYVLEL